MFEEFKKISINFNNLSELTLKNEPIFLSVKMEDVPFEFLINPKENTNKAIIFGSGAFDSSKLKPPVFNRHKWKDDFDATTVYYSDPTLYLGKLNLAWGYGNKDRHFLKDIASILKILLEKMSIQNENTLFMGSSGGGFTSFMLATLLKGSKVFVNNPQTNITKYFKSPVKQLYNTIYPTAGEGFENFESERVNVVEFFKVNKHVPKIYYAQNLSSKHDIENHLMPFIKELSQLDGKSFSNRITMQYYYDKEKGHNPMNKEETIQIMNEILYQDKMKETISN